MISLWAMTLPLRLITEVSGDYGVDANLVISIVSVESDGDACATRYESHYRYLDDPEIFAKVNNITTETEVVHQKTSWGLMQVMGGVARELGFVDSLVKLCEPYLGLKMGVKKLSLLIKKYHHIWDAVSAYNQGSPRKDDKGLYYNQSYVDKVFQKYDELIK